MTGQYVIEHYLSATNVQAEFIWPIQIHETTIYREDEQDNSATEPFSDTNFEAIQQHVLRQQILSISIDPFHLYHVISVVQSSY